MLTLRFDPDTGTGFISKGKLQGAFKATEAQFQEAVNNGNILVSALAQITWSVECTEGIIEAGGEFGTDLTYELVENNQGQVTGIELTGYEDPTDPFGLEGGPGDVCNEGFVRVLGVAEFEVTYISMCRFHNLELFTCQFRRVKK